MMNKCQVLFHEKNLQRLIKICLKFPMGSNYYLDHSIISCIRAAEYISEGFYHTIFQALLLLVTLHIIL